MGRLAGTRGPPLLVVNSPPQLGLVHARATLHAERAGLLVELLAGAPPRPGVTLGLGLVKLAGVTVREIRKRLAQAEQRREHVSVALDAFEQLRGLSAQLQIASAPARGPFGLLPGQRRGDRRTLLRTQG